MIPVTAAGGVLYRKIDGKVLVLLIWRREVWDLPKGKKEDEETVEECARREVAEEVGIDKPEVERFLTKTYHEYEQGGDHFGKTTHWFKMHTTKKTGFTPEREEGIQKVKWIELDEAKRKVGYDNLVKVLQTLYDTI